MSRDVEPGWRYRNEAVPPDDSALDEMIETQLADLVAYCRALTGEETEAVSTAQSVLDSAHSLLSDPEVLRAWLFALARRRALAARPGGSAQADSPQAQELLDLVHRHGIRPQDLPVVLGIPAVEAAEQLAAAEAENDRRAPRRTDDSDRSGSNGRHDGSGLDDCAERDEWSRRDDRTWQDGRAEPDDWAQRDGWTDRDDTGGRDDDQSLDDLEGLMRPPADSAGRHAARGGWQALAGSRVRLAAATAAVVAVIGVGAAYLAESFHGAGSPRPAGLETSHHPSPAAQTPASSPSPTPSASPSHSPAPSKSITVVPPRPAPTSTKPKSPPPTTPPPTTPPPTTPPPTTPPPTTPPAGP